MLQAIQQNPLVALILLLIPCVGATWVVVHNLYVKPRDFRIQTLEKHVEQLRNEQLRNSSTTKASLSAVDATLTVPTEKPPDRDGEKSLRVSAGLELSNSDNALRSLADCYKQWTDPQKTDLQRKKFEETYTGCPISWEVFTSSVDKSEYSITLWAGANHESHSWEPRTTVRFPLEMEAELLSLKKGELVRIEGKIREFFLNPVIEGSSIRRIAKAA